MTASSRCEGMEERQYESVVEGSACSAVIRRCRHLVVSLESEGTSYYACRCMLGEKDEGS